MTTIYFAQSVSQDGQIILALSSPDLPAGAFNFQLNLNYTGIGTPFNSVKFSGASTTSVSSSSLTASGSVSMSGTLNPGSGGSFATIAFDARGSGFFDADVTSLKINSVSAGFTDPPAFSYIVLSLSETVAIIQNNGTTGVFNPYNSILPGVSITQQPAHGTVSFNASLFTAPTWTYTPATDYYGADVFTVMVSDGGNAKEKTVNLNISPVGTNNNDVFVASKAALSIDGKAGLDTLIASGPQANYTISSFVAAGITSYVVTDRTGVDGINTLTSVERIQFTDTNVALDINGTGGQVYRLYQAAFNRAPDVAGLGFQMSAIDKSGLTLNQIAQNFITSPEFVRTYGSLSNTAFVTQLYANVLHRVPEAEGLKFHTDLLNANAVSRATDLVGFSESAENQAALIGVIGNGFAFTPLA